MLGKFFPHMVSKQQGKTASLSVLAAWAPRSGSGEVAPCGRSLGSPSLSSRQTRGRKLVGAKTDEGQEACGGKASNAAPITNTELIGGHQLISCGCSPRAPAWRPPPAPPKAQGKSAALRGCPVCPDGGRLAKARVHFENEQGRIRPSEGHCGPVVQAHLGARALGTRGEGPRQGLWMRGSRRWSRSPPCLPILLCPSAAWDPVSDPYTDTPTRRPGHPEIMLKVPHVLPASPQQGPKGFI